MRSQNTWHATDDNHQVPLSEGAISPAAAKQERPVSAPFCPGGEDRSPDHTATSKGFAAPARSPRQQALIESIALGEVVFSTHLDGFYFNRVLQFELAQEDQEFLKALYATGEIWHKPMVGGEFEVRLCEGQSMADAR